MKAFISLQFNNVQGMTCTVMYGDMIYYFWNLLGKNKLATVHSSDFQVLAACLDYPSISNYIQNISPIFNELWLSDEYRSQKSIKNLHVNFFKIV